MSHKMTRRTAILRTAGIAAMSLFGAPRLDTVIERVVERVSEAQGINKIAGIVADELGNASFTKSAYGEECSV